MTKQKLMMVILVLTLGITSIGATGCGTSVPAGHRGVFFNFWSGLDTETTLGEGFHFKMPWNSIIVYDVRLRELKEGMNILAADQLNLRVEISLQYRLKGKSTAQLHQNLGPRFEKTVIIPTLRNVLREVITEYKSTAAYLRRQEIQERVATKFTEKIAKNDYFVLDNILIRNIDFPKIVEEAINRKLAMKQDAERMEFVLEKERKEADRKKIEAAGIADFQTIVAQGINENLLRWKAIEATLTLSESPNTKVVVVGSGKDGLPIILGK